MNINYKKVLGITLAGLMVVAPMVSSASDHSMEETKSIKATATTEALEAEVGDVGSELPDKVMSEPIKATATTEALQVDVGSELPDEVMSESIEATEIIEIAKKK